MKKNIEELNYSEFVGLINERNRPSGGIKTIQEVVVNARIDKGSKVLEIGSNTGFISVNISLLTLPATLWLRDGKTIVADIDNFDYEAGKAVDNPVNNLSKKAKDDFFWVTVKPKKWPKDFIEAGDICACVGFKDIRQRRQPYPR